MMGAYAENILYHIPNTFSKEERIRAAPAAMQNAKISFFDWKN